MQHLRQGLKMNIEYIPLVLGWISAITGILLTIFLNYRSKHIFDHPFVYGSILGVFILILGNELLIATGTDGNLLITANNLGDDFESYLPLAGLIISFAYLAHSLDSSGFFEFCANKIVFKWGKNTWMLYISLYGLVSLLTFFTTNDIVILSMTTIVIYIGRRLNITNMVPFLLMQYYAANIVSMGLYIGSPTNVVIGDKVDWSFFEYAKHMLAPTITAFITGGIILSILFAKQINEIKITCKLPNVLDKMTVFDTEMAYKIFIFSSLLITLSYNSLNNDEIEIWKICLIFLGITLISDIIIEINRRKKFLFIPGKRIAIYYLKDAIKSMPWTIVPFLLSMGILVHGVSNLHLSSVYINAVNFLGDANLLNTDNSAYNYIKLSLAHAFASAGLVNVMNDIPSSLFIAESMKEITSSDIYPSNLKNMIIVSSLIGVNPGVGFSLSGALAGLMWMTILKNQHTPNIIFPSIKQLSLYGIFGMTTIIATTGIVNGLIYYFNLI